MPNRRAISDFFGGYLHQDWRLDYGDSWQALTAFWWEAPDLAAGLPAEIDELLQSRTDEASLRVALLAVGANHIPTGTDGTVRSWLVEVRRRTEEHLAGP